MHFKVEVLRCTTEENLGNHMCFLGREDKKIAVLSEGN